MEHEERGERRLILDTCALLFNLRARLGFCCTYQGNSQQLEQTIASLSFVGTIRVTLTAVLFTLAAVFFAPQTLLFTINFALMLLLQHHRSSYG
ncbi:uncharacterized protein IUM83_12704 [Phytophthora cinnamomi]|uniref:uncharacterized protein n=1 Tax=Phytophthora cinnamomi TaxID=4785 RepID=UPI00355AC0CB|nr:hypothetical protein IUM83_12704 [Phytophthora cinnamomi]